MAKKKVVKKKAAKKKTKKSTRRKKPPQVIQIPNEPTLADLHQKKLKIMQEVPIIPCSAIMKDRQGQIFAYTKAEKIFAIFAQKCRDYKLVVAPIEVDMSETAPVFNGEKLVKISRSRAVMRFQITDTESGQSETFMGAGLGDNDVWSDNSSQTVAMKQGLIMYFFTAWPQPDSHLDLIREELAGQSAADFVAGIKAIMPEKGSKDAKRLNAEGAMKAIMQFFADY